MPLINIRCLNFTGTLTELKYQEIGSYLWFCTLKSDDEKKYRGAKSPDYANFRLYQGIPTDPIIHYNI